MGSTFSTMIVLNRSRSSEWGRCADLSNQTSSLAGALSEIEIPLGYFAGNFPLIPSLHEEDRHSHLRHGGEQVNLEQLRPQDPHGAGTTPEEVEPVSRVFSRETSRPPITRPNAPCLLAWTSPPNRPRLASEQLSFSASHPRGAAAPCSRGLLIALRFPCFPAWPRVHW